MQQPRSGHRHSLRSLILRPYAFAAEFFDRWYEELPWRRRVPLGKRGEQIAARYLRRSGYLIIKRNYRAAGAEVDLIAVEDQTLVFVEVKARSGKRLGTPQEAVDERKQNRIRRAAEVYAARNRVTEIPIRFDVVAIVGAGRGRKLELIRNAF